MIKNLLQKLEDYLENRRIEQIRKKPEKLLEEAEFIINYEGDVREAADLSWIAVYLREKLDYQEGLSEFRERAQLCTFQAYDPLKSEDPAIRELAFDKTKTDKIKTLEEMAAEKFRLGLEERALEYYLEAFDMAKNLDQELQEEVKENFEKVVKEVYGERQERNL